MPGWSEDWIVSLPLLLLMVVVHVFGLGAIRGQIVSRLEAAAGGRRFSIVFAFVIGVCILLMTVLHSLEAAAWGLVYLGLGALPDPKSAMLFSLEAMTTYGHSNLYLAPRWQMMGAVEALNGVMLFGLTIATLSSVIDSVSTHTGPQKRSE